MPPLTVLICLFFVTNFLFCDGESSSVVVDVDPVPREDVLSFQQAETTSIVIPQSLTYALLDVKNVNRTDGAPFSVQPLNSIHIQDYGSRMLAGQYVPRLVIRRIINSTQDVFTNLLYKKHHWLNYQQLQHHLQPQQQQRQQQKQQHHHHNGYIIDSPSSSPSSPDKEENVIPTLRYGVNYTENDGYVFLLHDMCYPHLQLHSPIRSRSAYEMWSHTGEESITFVNHKISPSRISAIFTMAGRRVPDMLAQETNQQHHNHYQNNPYMYAAYDEENDPPTFLDAFSMQVKFVSVSEKVYVASLQISQHDQPTHKSCGGENYLTCRLNRLKDIHLIKLATNDYNYINNHKNRDLIPMSNLGTLGDIPTLDVTVQFGHNDALKHMYSIPVHSFSVVSPNLYNFLYHQNSIHFQSIEYSRLFMHDRVNASFRVLGYNASLPVSSFQFLPYLNDQPPTLSSYTNQRGSSLTSQLILAVGSGQGQGVGAGLISFLEQLTTIEGKDVQTSIHVTVPVTPDVLHTYCFLHARPTLVTPSIVYHGSPTLTNDSEDKILKFTVKQVDLVVHQI